MEKTPLGSIPLFISVPHTETFVTKNLKNTSSSFLKISTQLQTTQLGSILTSNKETVSNTSYGLTWKVLSVCISRAFFTFSRHEL